MSDHFFWEISMRKIAFILLIPVMLANCGWQKDTTDGRIDEAKVGKIVEGKTALTDVFDILGVPDKITQIKSGTIIEYRFTQLKALRAFMFIVNFANYETRFDRVLVYADENDIVRKVSASFEAEEAKYEMPWSNSPQVAQ